MYSEDLKILIERLLSAETSRRPRLVVFFSLHVYDNSALHSPEEILMLPLLQKATTLPPRECCNCFRPILCYVKPITFCNGVWLLCFVGG